VKFKKKFSSPHILLLKVIAKVEKTWIFYYFREEKTDKTKIHKKIMFFNLELSN